MIFLVEYDRARGEIESFKAFGNANRKEAEDTRLELELDLNRRGIEREVVLLEAASEAAVRRTHRRYFETLEELAATRLSA